MQAVRELIAEEFDQANALIVEQLQSKVPLVENIGQYLIQAGGKRLRPMLALLAGKICGFSQEKHVPFAVIIEFIHSATLLHDDVVDLSQMRRGRPTANANFGNAPSVLVGDFIYSRAFQMLVSLNDMAVMRLLSDTTNQIAEGEVLQLANAGNPDCSRESYFQVITDKTAILFAAAMQGSGQLAGADTRQQRALHNYGLQLGIAFQLADDLLDYQGNFQETGKNIGDDLAEGKPTLPLIYALENCTHAEGTLIREAIRDKSAARLEEIIAITHKTGALKFTEEKALKAVTDARTHLSGFPESPFRSALESIADFAISRSN